jgi:hypothetical protein
VNKKLFSFPYFPFPHFVSDLFEEFFSFLNHH